MAKKKTRRVNRRTGKPFNNESEYFKDWTVQKLLKEAKALNYVINVAECYSSSDIVDMLGVLLELHGRGYDEVANISFRKG
jgi:hypothetical protein